MRQDTAMAILKTGVNVFLTGAAGSGKTYVLNQYIRYLREHGVSVAVTASTGIAATHLGGMTIHAWSGIGVRDTLADDEILKLQGTERIKKHFKYTKVLVIDEVSMLHAYQLDMVERIARHMLDFTKPFGGLQVILCGDFFQLPPVSRGGLMSRFVYESNAWGLGQFQICYLTEQYRQGNDPLLSVLSDIRNGTTGEHTKIPLRTRYRKVPTNGGIATKLFSRNANVDRINDEHLTKLDGEEHIFEMESKGPKKLVESLKQNCIAPEVLRLKEGAEVMFVKNATDGTYVNGTRGSIANFDKDDDTPIVKTLDGRFVRAEPMEWRFEEDGVVRAMVIQIPLRLAWAITIHKSQGMTLDAAEVDLSDAFEPGMGYVALSRLRSLDGLTLLGLNQTALSVHPKVLQGDTRMREWSEQAAFVIDTHDAEALRRMHETVLLVRFGGTCAKRSLAKNHRPNVPKKTSRQPTTSQKANNRSKNSG